MYKVLLIGIGSALGGMCRYGLSSFVHLFLNRSFPYGTFVVNSAGCLLMGFLFVVLLERFDGIGESLRAFLLIGFLGGFTTFSSFSIETMNLFEQNQNNLALLNVVLSVTLCLGLTWIGMLIGRQL
ncbi:MAG: fluoride efflux transporter CrcB [Gammaproteobacteria bacterium]|nr:fluoride efflux transporter CrcB [Gammaproteobacteria bacterium]